MILDWDDFSEHNHRYDLLWRLKEVRPDFRCTMFAVPALGSPEFWGAVPDWIELAVHGWTHHSVYECSDWPYERMERLLDHPIVEEFFATGFKAPGWQISDGCYRVLLERGWWVADHWDNDDRRPPGLLAHVITPAAAAGQDPIHWHGHIGNVCGNGIEETFPRLLARVTEAEIGRAHV